MVETGQPHQEDRVEPSLNPTAAPGKEREDKGASPARYA